MEEPPPPIPLNAVVPSASATYFHVSPSLNAAVPSHPFPIGSNHINIVPVGLSPETVYAYQSLPLQQHPPPLAQMHAQSAHPVLNTGTFWPQSAPTPEVPQVKKGESPDFYPTIDLYPGFAQPRPSVLDTLRTARKTSVSQPNLAPKRAQLVSQLSTPPKLVPMGLGLPQDAPPPSPLALWAAVRPPPLPYKTLLVSVADKPSPPPPPPLKPITPPSVSLSKSRWKPTTSQAAGQAPQAQAQGPPPPTSLTLNIAEQQNHYAPGPAETTEQPVEPVEKFTFKDGRVHSIPKARLKQKSKIFLAYFQAFNPSQEDLLAVRRLRRRIQCREASRVSRLKSKHDHLSLLHRFEELQATMRDRVVDSLRPIAERHLSHPAHVEELLSAAQQAIELLIESKPHDIQPSQSDDDSMSGGDDEPT